MTAAGPLRRETPFARQDARFSAGLLGMRLFLASLAMLFAASVVGMIVIRVQTGDEWPRDLPPMPSILWASTVLLLASSGTIQAAVASAEAGRAGRLAVAFTATVVLALAFLVLQTSAGVRWMSVVAPRWGHSEAYRFALSSFYVLTGLHAAHVLGGLVPMIVVAKRALEGRYAPGRHAGVRYCAIYWHFLDAVWLGLFALLVVML